MGARWREKHDLWAEGEAFPEVSMHTGLSVAGREWIVTSFVLNGGSDPQVTLELLDPEKFFKTVTIEDEPHVPCLHIDLDRDLYDSAGEATLCGLRREHDGDHDYTVVPG